MDGVVSRNAAASEEHVAQGFSSNGWYFLPVTFAHNRKEGVRWQVDVVPRHSIAIARNEKMARSSLCLRPLEILDEAKSREEVVGHLRHGCVCSHVRVRAIKPAQVVLFHLRYTSVFRE